MKSKRLIVISLDALGSTDFEMFSQLPIRNAPMTAPGMEPMPPNTAATKAFKPGIAPEV